MASDASKESVDISERDIVFDCPHCGGELVVDKDGAGMVFDCSHCSKPVTVPPFSGPHPSLSKEKTPAAPTTTASATAPAEASAPAEEAAAAKPKTYDLTGSDPEQISKRYEELKLQYKENTSQRTEIRGYINRAQIELHRYNLKLQKLIERQADMESEIKAIQEFLEKAKQ